MSIVVRRLAIIVLVMLVGLGVFSASAWAGTSGPEEITFQEGVAADNAALSDQYQASTGIEFGAPTTSGTTLGFPGTLPADMCVAQPALLTTGYTAPGASPVTVFAARSGGDSGCLSGGEFYQPEQGFLFHIDDARASLSLRLRAFTSQANETPDISGAEVIAYRGDGTVVDDVTLTGATSSDWSTVNLSTSDPDGIQFVAVIADISINAAVGVQIDDLTLPAAIPDVPADFRLAPSAQADIGDLVEGDTLDVPVQIVRENGSAGTVTVSATDGGSAALSNLTVDQSPSGEPPDTVLVQLTAAPGQVGNTVTVTVSGTGDPGAGEQEGPDLTLAFTVQRDLTLTAIAPTSIGGLCQISAGLELIVAGETPMTVDVSGPAGFSTSVNVTGPGEYQIADQLTADYAASNSEHFSFAAAQARPLGLPPQFAPTSTEVTLDDPTPQVTLTSGDSYTTPAEASEYPTSLTHISFTASGLPCEPLFLVVGADGAETPFSPGPQGGGSFTVPVPANATAPATGTTAPLEIVSPAGVNPVGSTIATLPGIFLSDFRADDAPHFLNDVDNNLQWSDMEQTFGPDVNDCVEVCWHDPFVEYVYDQLVGDEPFGLCFGYTMLATEFREDEASPLDFGAGSVGALSPPTGGTTTISSATGLGATTIPNYPVVNDSSPLGQTLVSDWLSQEDFQYHFVRNDGIGGFSTVQAFVKALSAALATDHVAIINMALPNGSAHSVAAYAVSPGPSGGYTISVYNPNLGYADNDAIGSPPAPSGWFPDEAINGSDHTIVLGASQITLAPGSQQAAWTVTGGLATPVNSGLNTPAGSLWTGSMPFIGLTTLAQRPLDPTLTNFNEPLQAVENKLYGLVLTSSATDGPPQPPAGGPPVAISQITTGGKRQLNALGMPVRGSAISVHTPTDAGPADTAGTYELRRGHTYTVTTRTLHPGRFGLVQTGDGVAAGVAGAVAVAHHSDSVTLDPGSASITFSGDSSTAVTLELTRGKSARTERTLTLTLAHSAGATTAILNTSGKLTIDHNGPAVNLTVQLFARGVSVGSPAVSLRPGSRLDLTPKWSHLGGVVRLSSRGRRAGRLSFSRRRGTALSRILGLSHPKHKHRK